MRIALLALVACGTAAAPVTPKTAHDPFEAVADHIAKDALDSGEVVGLTVAIARRDGDTFVKGYGEADRARKIAASPDTIYRIGSLTKQFTAAAIMQLAEQGKLSIEDDISKYVKVDTGGRKVSIRHLLTHTSGIPDYTSRGDFVEFAKNPATPQQIVDLATKMLWEFDPGTHFHYSNTGYVVLGMVIERVSGQRYERYLYDHIFTPLKLAHTFYCDATHGARGYALDDDKLVDAAPLDLSIPFSAGALCSTAPDLVTWSRALASGQVVAPQTYAEMITPPSGIKTTYGFGLEVDRFGNHRQIWHNGGINGFVSELHVYPDDGITIVVLTNTESETAPEVEKSLAYAALKVPSPDVALPDAVRDAVVGAYDIPQLGKTEVAVVKKKLVIEPPGQGKLAMVYRGNDTFEIPGAGATLVFHRTDGKIVSMTIEQAGQKIDAPRSP